MKAEANVHPVATPQEQKISSNVAAHRFSTEGGSDIGDSRRPVCSCGWKGYEQGNYCSAQHTNFHEQFAAHFDVESLDREHSRSFNHNLVR